MPTNRVEDYIKYYRAIRENQPYKEKNNRVLAIQFEDMIYHYDETTEKIRDFLKLGDNPAPKSIFDPAISMPNTQVWKRYPQFAKDIKRIEEELPEYLFDYTSQISLEDIKKARNKDDSVKKEKKVISPYTMEPKKKNKIIPRIIWCLIIILVIIGGYFTYKTIADNNRAESNVLG